MILNAIQHSPAGGLVEVEAAELEDRGGPYVECTVRDSGPGFSEEAARVAFDPFFTMRRGETGLGLAVVRKIVEEHQGSITLGDAPEGGAIVRFRLPTSPRAS